MLLELFVHTINLSRNAARGLHPLIFCRIFGMWATEEFIKLGSYHSCATNLVHDHKRAMALYTSASSLGGQFNSGIRFDRIDLYCLHIRRHTSILFCMKPPIFEIRDDFRNISSGAASKWPRRMFLGSYLSSLTSIYYVTLVSRYIYWSKND